MQQKQTEEEQEEEEEGEEEEEEKGMEDEKSSDDDNAGKKELTMLSRVKRKRKQTSNSWEAKKLSCADCGRWFPSSALLDAHSLQHGTKKSGTRQNSSVKTQRNCNEEFLIKSSKLLYFPIVVEY